MQQIIYNKGKNQGIIKISIIKKLNSKICFNSKIYVKKDYSLKDRHTFKLAPNQHPTTYL